MFASTKLIFIASNTFRTINNRQIFSNLNYFRHIHKGYTTSNNSLNKNLQNMCCLSTNSKNTDLEKLYYGTLTPQIKAVKLISFTTSLGGIIAQPILLQQLMEIGGGLPAMIGICSFIGFFTFVTPFLIHFVTKKYITHLDYDPENKKYIATILSFFCRQQKIEFSIDDVKVPDIPGMFTTFEIKGRPLFVDPNLFVDPTHYGKLMGYDKPVDFKLYQNDSFKKSM